MKVSNETVAAVFNEIADLLDIQGANPFRIRAYRNGARRVLSYPKSMDSLVKEGFDLTELDGIGKDLAAKISEIVTTGKLLFLEELKKEVSPDLEQLMHIPSLGPKRVHRLHEELHIDTLSDLKRVIKSGEVESLSGFGPKTVTMIDKELDKASFGEKRYRLAEIEPVAKELKAYLEGSKGVVAIEVAGSIRRRKESVKDIDIVAACEGENDLMTRFVGMDDVETVVMQGDTRSSVILHSGVEVDVRVVPPSCFASALLHFTGSKSHNVALRKRAIEVGCKLNEYGFFRSDRRLETQDEEDIYRTLGMAYVEPELREDRGEIAAAAGGRLPSLVTLGDIRGDLHMHTTASDGAATIREMALAAKARGYEYIAITDHSKHVTIAHGMDEARLRSQLEEIDRLNDELRGIRILKSAEVDILENGSLDLPDSILGELDLAVCAVHYKLHLSKEEQTERILRAMENPYFSILAHPTGRLLGLREPYEVDMERIIEACRQNGVVLELNAQPDRLDLNDIHCKMAGEAGVKVAISTDAHSIPDLELMRYGINQARRGWLESGNVLNTLKLESLLQKVRRN
jgi:DNA polymerase (family 10)